MKRQWLGFVASIALIGTVGQARTPSFQGLGDLPGGVHQSVANGVSADGSTVVGWGVSSMSSPFAEASRWRADTGMEGLGFVRPNDDYSSTAKAVSANGSVVVGYSGGLYPYVAFRWTWSRMVNLGDLPGGPYGSAANSVSGDGSVVVGMSYVDAGRRAFVWTSDAGMVGLGDSPGAARDVSADGSVIVGVSGTQAFRFTSSTGLVGLGDLPGGETESQAFGVSADGRVVVGRGESASGTEAFLWTENDGMVGLGCVPGFDHSTAVAVSADGSVVVGNCFSPGQEASIWDPENGMRRLEDVLHVDYGLDVTDWTLARAEDISEDGQVIVGWGTNPDGYTEAWMAVIPEPATLSLLGVAAPALLRRGKSKRKGGAA